MAVGGHDRAGLGVDVAGDGTIGKGQVEVDGHQPLLPDRGACHQRAVREDGPARAPQRPGRAEIGLLGWGYLVRGA